MENETRMRLMFQKRSLTTGFLVTSLGIAAGLAVLSSPDVAVGADCGAGVKDARTKDHCKAGGRDAAKKAMKAAMDAANAAGAKGADGKKLDCKSCHEDTNATFKLNGDAEGLFKTHMD